MHDIRIKHGAGLKEGLPVAISVCCVNCAVVCTIITTSTQYIERHNNSRPDPMNIATKEIPSRSGEKRMLKRSAVQQCKVLYGTVINHANLLYTRPIEVLTEWPGSCGHLLSLFVPSGQTVNRVLRFSILIKLIQYHIYGYFALLFRCYKKFNSRNDTSLVIL